MSGSYYERWKRSGGLETQTTEHAAVHSRDEGHNQMERLRSIDERLQGCQGIVNQLVGRVGECEHRTEASTKLAQLTQHLTEQTTEESSEALQELRSKCLRQEEVMKKLITDFDALRQVQEINVSRAHSNNNQFVHEQILKVQNRYKEQLVSEVQQLRSEMDAKLQAIATETSNEVKMVATQLSNAMTDLHNDMASLKDYIKEEVRAVKLHCDNKIDVLTGKGTHNESVMNDMNAFQSSVIANVNTLQQHCRKLDEQFAEQRVRVRNMGNLDDKVTELDKKILDIDRLKTDFGEHVTAFKSHLQKQTNRANDTAAAIQQLIEMTDTSRAAISSEITGVKDWAMRCLQKLRKRTEQAMHEARLLKGEYTALATQVGRTHASNERQQQVMNELLTQQTEKAALLGKMVDREIDLKRHPRERSRSPKKNPDLEWELAERAKALNDQYMDAKSRVKCAHKKLLQEQGKKVKSPRASRREQIHNQLQDLQVM
eukprot:TRINITY_DN21166_c0_g1_i1.p1 TRINITY_DN21166_c0_g1~~TRINITY_DN21166_c0_g1_i1.p1  ORF type:complete len:494 (+),score=153.59 TRINITY_DN21166_c0_g1_i1:22-1482(+)